MSHNPEFNVWKTVVESIRPDIDKLTEIMKAGSKVLPELTKRGRYWQIQLVESWGSNDVTFKISQLDDHVIWTENQLKEWPDCTRTSWDMWNFKRKSDAEKFITLYNIVWPK